MVAASQSPNCEYVLRVSTVLVALIGLCAVIPYASASLKIPLAARNIYEQHHQMRRFAIDYYRQLIAVNDLGLVSYKNVSLVFGGLAQRRCGS